MDTFLLDLFCTAVLGGLLGILCCIKGLRLSSLDTVHRIRSDFFMIVVNSFYIRCYRDMLQNDMCLHAFYQEQHLPANFAFNQQFRDVEFPNGQWMSMSRACDFPTEIYWIPSNNYCWIYDDLRTPLKNLPMYLGSSQVGWECVYQFPPLVSEEHARTWIGAFRVPMDTPLP